MSEYQLLLKDQRWYDKRKVILERDGYQCTKCGFQYELQIHHIKYIWGLKPWEYEDQYLVTLCASCHSRVNQPESGGLKISSALAKSSVQSLRERMDAHRKKQNN